MPNLPVFPAFAPLDISHRDAVERALARRPAEVSELNFAEMLAWHGVRATQITEVHGCIGMCLVRHGRRCLYPPLGDANRPVAMRELLRHLRSQGSDGFVYGLTLAEAAEAAATGGLAAIEDADNADYVYRTADLVHLAGHRYDGKRNHVRNFTRSYDFHFARLTAADVPEVAEFQRQWCAVRGCAREPSLMDENHAVQELLRYYGQLEVMGATIRIDGRVQAFTVASPLNADTALVIVEKANPEFRGIYQTINQMFCEQVLEPYAWVNREQDAGDPGLRRAKLSYHPHHMVAKYRVALAD